MVVVGAGFACIITLVIQFLKSLQALPSRVNILTKNPYLFPLPHTQICFISSLFFDKKIDQNYEMLSHLARSAKISEYLVLTVAETVINAKKTEKNRLTRSKTGKISGFHVQLHVQRVEFPAP